MAFEYLGVQFFPLSAADAVNEVAKMRSPQVGKAAKRAPCIGLPCRSPLGKNLPSLITPSVVWKSTVTLTALPGDQASLLADQLDVATIEDRQLRIRGLALVLVAESAAEAGDRSAARHRRA